jgi:hypothetical protein
MTRDPLESRVEGGLTGVFRNQRKISFYFIQFLHSEVAWEAQSFLIAAWWLSKWTKHKGDYAPGGSAPTIPIALPPTMCKITKIQVILDSSAECAPRTHAINVPSQINALSTHLKDLSHLGQLCKACTSHPRCHWLHDVRPEGRHVLLIVRGLQQKMHTMRKVWSQRVIKMCVPMRLVGVWQSIAKRENRTDRKTKRLHWNCLNY